LSRTPLETKGHGAAMHTIHVYLSMRFFGFYEPGRHGGICRLIMGIGTQSNADFADGATKGFGQNCWNHLLMTRILNG